MHIHAYFIKFFTPIMMVSLENCRVGFSDGCNGVPLTESHTQSYLDGYSEGQAQCHNNGGGGTSDNTNDNSGQSTSHNTKEDSKLLCYAAGGLLMLGGVPAPAILSAGAAAHNAGLCP
jgi:hypothetical protein